MNRLQVLASTTAVVSGVLLSACASGTGSAPTAPTVQAAATQSAPTLQAAAPTVQAAATRAAPTVQAAATQLAPTIQAAATQAAPTLQAAATQAAPTLQAGAAQAAPTVQAAATQLAPTAQAAAASVPVRISAVNSTPGDATISVQNTSASGVDISGWSLQVGTSTARLPTGLNVQPNQTVTLHTGAGTSTASDIYLGNAGSALTSEIKPGARVVLQGPSGPPAAFTVPAM
jgi:Lamin Tail Domain